MAMNAQKQGKQRFFDTEGENSVYGFFGKSTLLLEGLRPGVDGTSHLFVQLGVPGCGKSTFLREFFLDVFSGKKLLRLIGKQPSVLLASVTN